MAQNMVVTGAVVATVVLCLSIVWLVRGAFVRHDPQRAATSVTVAANNPFELHLPGSPGELYFRFEINGDTDCNYDLLVSGEVVDESGSTRAFAVKTTQHSSLKGADVARYASTTYAVTTTTGSISLAAVRAGDRIARGVVSEHPSALLRKGSVYIPGSK